MHTHKTNTHTQNKLALTILHHHNNNNTNYYILTTHIGYIYTTIYAMGIETMKWKIRKYGIYAMGMEKIGDATTIKIQFSTCRFFIFVLTLILCIIDAGVSIILIVWLTFGVSSLLQLVQEFKIGPVLDNFSLVLFLSVFFFLSSKYINKYIWKKNIYEIFYSISFLSLDY